MPRRTGSRQSFNTSTSTEVDEVGVSSSTVAFGEGGGDCGAVETDGPAGEAVEAVPPTEVLGHAQAPARQTARAATVPAPSIPGPKRKTALGGQGGGSRRQCRRYVQACTGWVVPIAAVTRPRWRS
jgi:hypothetical protein